VKARASAIALMAVALFASARAHAQPVEPASPAPPAAEAPAASQAHDPEQLFREALVLMNEESFTEALAKLEEAQALDPGIGTQFNIAICYEKLGKLGTAWRNYAAVQQLAHASGKSQREENARAKLEELRPRLSLFVLAPEEPASTTVKVDGVVVPPSQWATYAVDPGIHRVDAEAAARKPWTDSVSAPAEGQAATIRIPILASVAQTRIVTVGEPTNDGRRTLGLVLGGIGVASLIAASITGVVILNDKSTADDGCKPRCANADGTPNQRAIDAVNEGKTLVPINLVAWGVAAVGLGAGTYFILTSGKKVTPMAGAHALGLVLSGPL
jgi:hypothetical protein